MKIFFIDHAEGRTWTYDDLIQDLNNMQTGGRYLYEKSTYHILLNLVHSMANGYQVTMLDSDFSIGELTNLGIFDPEELNQRFSTPKLNIGSHSELLERIHSQRNRWTIGLYTSGTTGKPKCIYQTFDGLVRNVKQGAKYAKDVWGLAYNPTHIAGIQVFLQAFLNGNPIVDMFGKSNQQAISDILRRYGITRISATPTYYRMALGRLTGSFPKVASLTFGGERFDPPLIEALKPFFPNASIHNTYASTELGTLLQTNGEAFFIPSWLKDDVRISEDMELLIHRRFLGKTADECEQLPLVDGVWYPTGDIVERTTDGRFRFVHRKSELINVGGYKVNPAEVEDEIKKLEGVVDAVVKGRKNRLAGNVLVVEVVIREDSVKEEVARKIMRDLPLQPWKIPRQVYFVEELQHNRSGKKSRT